MDAFGVVPNGRREHAVHRKSELGQRYSRAFSTILGMMEPSRGQESSRQGLELTSMSQTL